MHTLERKVRRLSLSLTLLFIASTVAGAEGSQLPKDPRALLQLAAKSNAIARADIHPWHLKATYTLFDATGSAASQGTFEEWWVSAIKRKTTYGSPTFSQTEYVTEKGRFRRGAQTIPPILLSMLGDQFTKPVPFNEQQIDQMIVDREVRKEGGVKFVCLRWSGVRTPTGTRNFVGPAYCLNDDQPVLVSSESTPGPVQFSRTSIVPFEGRYVPRNLVAFQSGKKVIEAHIQTLEDLEGIDEADFAPASDATPIALKISVSAGVAQTMLMKRVDPEYPAAAKSAGISGTVLLQALIGKDGHILDLHAISGPSELQQAAVDAVQKWSYRPYLLNNEPVEVHTTINVVFAPGR